MEYEDVRHMLVSVHRNLVVGLPRAGLSLSTLTFLDALCLETAPRLRLLEAAMTAPDPVQLLREAGVEVPPEVSRWVRWREQVEHSCLAGSSETGWSEIHCCDCEFGPSCDEGDHYPPFLALAELVAALYYFSGEPPIDLVLEEREQHRGQ
jgi:hypothetical protein